MGSSRYKFRAWVNTYSHWHMTDKISIGSDGVFFHAGESNLTNPEWKLIQYTGLKDKNGTEIYEGDILEAQHKLKTQKFKRKYQVIFNERGYWDAVSLDDKPVRLCYAGFDKCEVIGNIYEDSHLLEVTE